MKNTNPALLLLLILSPVLLIAQPSSKIVFESRTYNFDTIQEIDGIVKGIFKFKNEGDAPLRIRDVLPGCGCTTSGWTKKPVNPGFGGEISANYDPANRPGKFNKILSVKTNDPVNPFMVLFINGYVIGRPKTALDKYPAKSGNLYFRKTNISFNDVTKNEVKTDTIYMLNNWDSAMNLSFSSVPAHISVEAVPTVLKPNTKGLLVVKYDGSKKDDWGLQFDRFRIVTNDVVDPAKWIILSAKIKDDYSTLTEKELKNAPKLVFETRVFDFDTIKDGEKTSYEYKFRNDGKTDLVIKKIKSSCGCTTALPEKMLLKPGEGSVIGVTFDSHNRKGRQHKVVTVVSNDPQNQLINLSIKGIVIE